MKQIKKQLLTCFVLFIALRTVGQVSMTVQLPPAGVLQKGQLWNILVVSASNTPVNARIMLRLSDARTNQPLLTGVSRTVAINKGAKQLQAGDVSPVQYEYLSAAVDRSVNGMLMAGNYIACYSIVIEGDKFGELASEDCIPFAVEPMSPPLLNSPEDNAILETPLPQFTWLPPAPVTIFNDLNYELILTTVRPGQSAVEAMQQNMPVFRVPHNKNLFTNYPSSAITLDTAANYAWTVIAKNGNEFTAQTEVWTFRIKHKQANHTETGSAYVQLKKELDGAIATMSNDLKCTYTNEANDSIVKYEIIGLSEGNNVLQQGTLKLKGGINLLNLQVDRKSHLQEGKSYQLRLLNSRNEYWLMKFIYVKGD